MNRRRLLAALAVAGVAAAGSPGRAVEGLSGSAGLGVAVSGRDEDNAKFREFWYDQRSAFGVTPQGHVRYEFGVAGIPFHAEAEVNARTGLTRRAHDGDAAVEAGSYGLFRIRGSFERIGHQFAHDAPSVYGGIGTGTLTLPDGLQATMQASATPFRAGILDAAVDAADLVDLGLRRDRVRAGAEVVALDPFTLAVEFAGERRKGARPYGTLFGSPGSNDVVEIAEPIDHDTVHLGLRAGYAGKLPGVGIPLAAGLSFAHAGFTNRIESVAYDNLFTLTDSRTGGAAVGRSALAPSNTANTWGASLSATLPHAIGLSGRVSLATFDQDAILLPATTNATWHPVLPLPRATAEARVATALYAGAVTFRPVPRVSWRLGYAQRERDNRTEGFLPTRIAVTDTTTRTGTESEYVSFTEHTLEGEQRLDLGHATDLITAYEHEDTSFRHGSASRLVQNRFTVAVDTRALSWISARVSAEHAARESNYADYTKADAEIPWMRKFHAADRDQDRLAVMATLSALEDVAISLQHTEGLDTYPHSFFGLQRDRRRASTVDATWEPDATVSVSTFYTHETSVLHQRSRQWSSNGAGDPYSKAPGTEDPSNWDLDNTTLVHTIGLTSALQLVPDRLFLQLDGTATLARGRVDFASAVGVTPIADANAFIPPPILSSDESRSVTAAASASYRFTPALVGTLGYRYDVWKFDDFLSLGYDPVLLNAFGGFNSLLSMDTLPKDYEVHTLFARATWVF